MAREPGANGICVNAIAPGLTPYEANARCVPVERHAPYENERIQQRAQHPADINGTELYLLSGLSDFVSGQALLVNGGLVFNKREDGYVNAPSNTGKRTQPLHGAGTGEGPEHVDVVWTAAW